MTNLKQFFGGGAESSQPCGSGALGPGDSDPESSVVSAPAPLRHNHDVPHLSFPSSTGAANWQRRGDLGFPAGDSEDFNGEDGARTGLDEALTGEGDTFTGDA
ncbi:hypothetical protein KGM_207241 [Danaus plexippus plexippus]|uniref:Uncharacterized protein n=1 Tax=Danaus plexippus plexippus TaxID=278856 RepID=A0A212FG13_DANPL|nr:hypothetical protein KGM_207241 [Danaus plexippus plexippus]